jgi:lipid-binding SYLF domain-containing protein
MIEISRRTFVMLSGTGLALAACGNGLGSNGAAKLDARVEATRAYLLKNYPGTQDLMDRAAGVLYMPLMTEAGFGLGGAYGRGALQINGVTVDYYSAAQASFGLTLGAQQYAHALFFMTPDALENFRRQDGWQAGAGVTYALPDGGGSAGVDTTTTTAPVIALVFGQAGFIAGASLDGTKYTRIIP